MPTQKKDTDALLKSVKQLDKSMQKIVEQNKELLDPIRNLQLYFLRGVLYGIGIIVAVAIVIPFVIHLLRYVEWVPLIGDFLVEIVEQIEQANVVR